METASRQPADAVYNRHAMSTGYTENNAAHGAQVPGTGPAGTTSTGSEAPGYLQQARETLASVAETVQNAVGIETPASTLHAIADNAKIQTSMPTTEKDGALPGEHVGGVGALPGKVDEAGVARLPDERTSVPSREYEGTYPGKKVGGVGALPGKQTETGVAILPDERAAEEKAGVEASTFAAAHPKSENPDKTDLKTAAAHPVETAKQARRGSTSSSSSSEEEGVDKSHKKISLKNKVAGAIKVAHGKVKKDEEKIAEGQALRGH